MIEKPERYIEVFSKALFTRDSIIVHVETCPHLYKTLQMIIDSGLKTGVALNPATPLEMIKHVLDKLNVILIMTVNPGFGGQQFITTMIKKITQAREIVDKFGKNIDIQVDGGVNIKNIETVNKAGANILVVGSEIFEAENPENMIRDIQKKLQIL